MKKIPFGNDWLFIEEANNPSETKSHMVTLPHDATQETGRSAKAPSGSGYAFYEGGVYTYEKTFPAPMEWKDQDIDLLLEGVYPKASVALNGREIGTCAYGYSHYIMPLSCLCYGKENTLTIRVDNTATPNSRWYAGAGIYRPVWLVQGARSHIPYHGIRVTTLSASPARIRVEIRHTGEGDASLEILDGDTVMASAQGEDVIIDLPGARLWDAEHPYLYTCRAFLRQGETVVDTDQITFGIRTISWSTQGLFVNGRKTLLRGGCVHADNGILGARSLDEAEWRRIRILKQWGFNAIRSAHQPLCRAALEACDALGMYVMDETWDMWNKHKTAHDYADRFLDNWTKKTIIILPSFSTPSAMKSRSRQNPRECPWPEKSSGKSKNGTKRARLRPASISR